MTTSTDKKTRRELLLSAATGCAAFCIQAPARAADSGQLNKLSEDDPVAVAFAYVHDATVLADGIRTSNNDVCGNCQLFHGQENWGKCQIFQEKQVSALGWCKAWIPKQ